MSIKVLPDGSFEVGSAAEALELSNLIRAKNSTAPETPKNGKPQSKMTVGAESALEIAGEFSDWVLPSAIKFLAAIQEAPSAGAELQTMMSAIGISDHKALGGRTAGIRKLIARCGFQNVSHVYERTPDGRFWKARARLPEALNALKAIIKAAH